MAVPEADALSFLAAGSQTPLAVPTGDLRPSPRVDRFGVDVFFPEPHGDEAAVRRYADESQDEAEPWGVALGEPTSTTTLAVPRAVVEEVERSRRMLLVRLPVGGAGGRALRGLIHPVPS